MEIVLIKAAIMLKWNSFDPETSRIISVLLIKSPQTQDGVGAVGCELTSSNNL
jgi:hypothetical protein